MRMQGFSDFYTSLEHCQNCSGEMAAAKIPKNWFYVCSNDDKLLFIEWNNIADLSPSQAPSVYNSRVSSVLPTPSTIPRPSNVYFSNGIDSEPTYGPTRKLDFELEMGYFLSKPVPWGERLEIQDAKEHIFGFVLLNDWSARDHQLFEMRPLVRTDSSSPLPCLCIQTRTNRTLTNNAQGPFHSKGFGTSISNWIVPLEALEPFACSPNTPQTPPPFPHLTWPNPSTGALDIKLKITLIRAGQSHPISSSNLKYMYWTPYQQLTHHAASGCGMQTGDLIGTGTISGSRTDGEGRKVELGCLYEVEMTGTKVMPEGVQGSEYQVGYLEDGDEVVLEGWCEDEGGRKVLGFGECRGRVAPAKA